MWSSKAIHACIWIGSHSRTCQYCQVDNFTTWGQDGLSNRSPNGRRSEEDGVEVYHNKHSVPSEVFYWVFNNNMPEIIKTLVNDCGFQFRWIDHERYLPMMIHRLFETEEYESHPRWVGDIDEEDLMYENSRVRRRMRAASAYSEQMNNA